MYRNILIPVVFGENSNTATALIAARTLGGSDAQITLLHVIETVPVYVSEYITTAVMQSTRKAITLKMTELAKELPGCEMAFAEGRPGPEISRYASDHGTDCIVIASHQPAFSDILLGSVAHHVVRHAKCSVTVLR